VCLLCLCELLCLSDVQLRKDNTGYDLQLFIGSEGYLGGFFCANCDG
jgi:hypothetical protein